MATSTVDLGLHGFTHGGEAVGRLPDGKACFVAFALPGERVRVAVVEQHQRWCRARLVEVVEPSPDRVEPPCPYFMTCGGCQLQHISAAGQAQLKRRIVTEQLERVGGISDPPVAETVPAGEDSYRTRARFGVDGQGRLGFRRFHSHEVIPIDRCLLLTGDTQSLREEAGDHWEGMVEVEVRTGSEGGRALVLRPAATASPTLSAALPGSMPVAVPGSVPVAVPGSMPVAVPGSMPVAVPGSMPVAMLDGRGGAVALRGDPTLWERSADRLLRVSAASFSQTNPRAATLLNSLVREAAAVSAGDTALELFAGTGRFTAVLAADGARVTAVEASASAAADLARNYADQPRVRTVRDDAARVAAAWLRQRRRVDVVVLDPPRRGAGTTLCARVARLRPRVIVYVSCDPAALARDARALAAAGYPLDRAVPVDQFAQTAAIETVATARRRVGQTPVHNPYDEDPRTVSIDSTIRMRFPRLRLLAAGTLLGVGLVAVGANPAGSPLPSRAQQRDATAVLATAAAQPAPVAAPLPGPQRRVEATPQWISDAAMRVRVEQVLARPDLALPGPVGVSVVNPDGQTVVSAGGDLPLLPASTEKLLTAAAALEILGLDFRYTTTLAASASPDSDGIVAGDLVLRGGGDPALSTPVFATLIDPQRPRTPLEALADQAVAAGVRQVTGSVLGDPSVFPDEPAAPGWPDTYFHNGHTTRVSGLTLDTGRVYTVGARGVTATTADDPAAQAAAALYQLLRERGVVFGGTAGSTRAAPEASEPLGTVESPPMEDLLRHTVQHSDNHLADAIFRSVGVETGDGSWSGSARAAATALEPLSMPSNGVTLADGSGLSRNNRVSAAALTAVQAAITSSRFGERWQGLMAVSGESGTLRERLRGTVAEHRLRGKTGSLHDVRALAGSVVGPDGEHYHLAVVANGLPAAAVPVARALQDAVVVAVAEVLYGCLGASPAGVPNAQGQVAAPACTP